MNSFLTTFLFYFVIRSQRQETWNKRGQLFISTQFKRCHSFLSQWCHHSINYIPYRVLHFARTSPAFFNHRVEQVTWSQCENVNASEPFPQTFYVIIWSINQFLENYYLGSIFVVFTATRIMHDQFEMMVLFFFMAVDIQKMCTLLKL